MVVVVVVAPTVVEIGTDVDVAGGAVGSLDEFVADDPQPTSSSPAATSATALNVPPVRPFRARDNAGNGRFAPLLGPARPQYGR